jgi:hypothetical protein
MTSGPAKNHNKGPIGPLDPDQPPPAVPILKRHHRLRAKEAVEALRSMGVEITEKDVLSLDWRRSDAHSGTGSKGIHLGRHFEPAWLGPLGAFRMTCE